MFQNREEAGGLLGEKLKEKYGQDAVVLGIPRGGVVLAKVVADLLGVPLDIVVVKKIGAPDNEELAIGSVGPNKTVYWEKKICQQLGISKPEKSNLKNQKERERGQKEKILRGDKLPFKISNKTVILVDDGVATGATVMAAAYFLKKQKVKEAILATPVIAKDTLPKMKKYFAEIIYLDAPRQFYAVGQFYQDFPQVEDEEVRRLLS